MTKSALVDMLENGILKEQSSTKYLYDTYCLRIVNLLEFIKDGDTEIKNISALDGFSEEGVFDNYVRDHTADETEILLKQIESGVRDWVRNASETIDSYKFKAAASGKEVHKYIGSAGKRRWASILFLALFGCGAILTVVFAFLDNFNVIDYGGTAAGASGIIDLAIGVIAFIVERVNDMRVTNGMEAAEQVHDGESYRQYNVNISRSFNHNKVIDKSKHSHYGEKK